MVVGILQLNLLGLPRSIVGVKDLMCVVLTAIYHVNDDEKDDISDCITNNDPITVIYRYEPRSNKTHYNKNVNKKCLVV
jgi:hypothetical protein